MRDLVKELWGPTLGVVIAFVGPWLWNKVKKHYLRPVETETGLAAIEKKLDDFMEHYSAGVAHNRESQRVLFTVQDRQFKVMRSQTGAIKELSKSVCNGNKEEALRLCSEADAYCANGEDLQKDYLLKK